MTYHVNHNFFNNMSTEAQAYCLGFFYARASGHIQLRREDTQILRNICFLLDYNGPIRAYEKIVEINICQKNFTNRLLSLGCQLNSKTMSSLPNISSFLLSSFIRSIFENYGRMYLVKQKYLNISIVFNEQFIQELRAFLKQNLNISTKHYYRYTYTNTVQMMITNSNDSKKFLNWIYLSASYYLARKYNKYRKFVENGV